MKYFSPIFILCTHIYITSQNKVTVELDYLYEIAGDNETQVGTSGNVKHSVQSFASQIFEILDPVDTTLHGGAVHAQKVQFLSTLTNVGKISVDTFVMKSAGTVGTDSESWAVRANDVKFNIVLSDWNFCSPCGSGNNARSSEWIDVAVKIKGKGAKPVS